MGTPVWVAYICLKELHNSVSISFWSPLYVNTQSSIWHSLVHISVTMIIMNIPTFQHSEIIIDRKNWTKNIVLDPSM